MKRLNIFVKLKLFAKSIWLRFLRIKFVATASAWLKTPASTGIWRKILQPPLVMRVILWLIIFAAFLFYAFNSLDPDFGWHLRAGQIFASSGVPKTDIFTYLATNFPWVDHEWLSDILLAKIYAFSGFLGLAIFYGVLWFAAIFIVARKVNIWLVLAISVMILSFSGVRQIAWTMFFLAILLILLKKYLRAKNFHDLLISPKLFAQNSFKSSEGVSIAAVRRRSRTLARTGLGHFSASRKLVLNIFFLVALVVLLYLWSLLHGGFAIGFAVVIFVAIFRRSWSLILASFLAALLTLANPYGVGIYVEVWRTLGDSALKMNINEWRPILLQMTYSRGLVLLLFGLGFIWRIFQSYEAFSRDRPQEIAGDLTENSTKRFAKDSNNNLSNSFAKDFRLRLRWRAWRNSYLVKNYHEFFNLENVFLLSAFSAARNWPLFGLVVLRRLDSDFRVLFSSVPKKIMWGLQIIFAVIFAAFLYFLVISYVPNFRVNVDREADSPIAAVKYLRGNPCAGNLFNHYNIGGYLIWKLPEERIFIDGRMPSWKSDSGEKYFDDFKKVYDDKKFRNAIFAKFDIRCVLTSRDDGLARDLIKSRDWRTAVKDDFWILLIKN